METNEKQMWKTRQNYFAVHKLNEDGLKKAKIIEEGFNQLLDYIEPFLMEGRHKSLLITKLEEASFYAKKAMALDLSNQTVEG